MTLILKINICANDTYLSYIRNNREDIFNYKDEMTLAEGGKDINK